MQEQKMIGGFAESLGIEIVGASPERVELGWAVRPELWQEHGILHGGVCASVVETAASIGAALWFGERGNVVGVTNQTDYLHPVREGGLRAVARPHHRDDRQQLWGVEIVDERERVVARGQVRLQNLVTEQDAEVSPRGG